MTDVEYPPRLSLSGGDPDVRTLNYLTVWRLTDIRKGRRTGPARFETRALSELPAGSVPTLASDVGGGRRNKRKRLTSLCFRIRFEHFARLTDTG